MQQGQFISNPAGAVVRTSLGHECTAPCEVKVARKQPFTAEFTCKGRKKTVRVETKMRGGGTAGAVGNVILGGVIGMAVDASSGATLDHVPNPVIIDF